MYTLEEVILNIRKSQIYFVSKKSRIIKTKADINKNETEQLMD